MVDPLGDAVQVTDTEPLVLTVAVTPLGAVGAAGMMTELEAPDGLLVPLALVAVTENV